MKKENPAMVVALIPARGGSKGVPRKNLQLVQGYPLIAYSIIAAQSAAGIDRVVVSTDSEEIASVARHFGAEVPFLRPSIYAQDNSPDQDFVNHALTWFKENEKTVPDLFVHLRPTTPLREPFLIDQAINKIKQYPQATSLRSAHACSESPFKWFLLKGDFFSGLNTDDMDFLNNPRQKFPQVYIPNGYVDVLRTKYIEATGHIHGQNVLSFITPSCTEIDVLEDFNRLDFEVQNSISSLIHHLKSNYPCKDLHA